MYITVREIFRKLAEESTAYEFLDWPTWACRTSGARNLLGYCSRPLRAGLTYAAPPALGFCCGGRTTVCGAAEKEKATLRVTKRAALEMRAVARTRLPVRLRYCTSVTLPLTKVTFRSL